MEPNHQTSCLILLSERTTKLLRLLARISSWHIEKLKYLVSTQSSKAVVPSTLPLQLILSCVPKYSTLPISESTYVEVVVEYSTLIFILHKSFEVRDDDADKLWE